MNPTNARRADRALAALRAGWDITAVNGEFALTDLLTDLMHLCRREGLSFAEQAARADTHFRAECLEASGGAHPAVTHGRCAVCGHYGDDCTGGAECGAARERLALDKLAGLLVTAEWSPSMLEDAAAIIRSVRTGEGAKPWVAH